MTRANELRANLRQRKAKAEMAFEKFKFDGMDKGIEPMAFASVQADEIATPSLPTVRGAGRRF